MSQGKSYEELKKRIAPSRQKLIKEHRNLFWHYVSERYQILLRRWDDKEFPWTDDPILRDYHFTNVFRLFDSGTLKLFDLLSEDDPPFKPIEDKQDVIWRVVQYRWPNYHTLFEEYGWIPQGFKKDKWLKRIDRVKSKHGKWHTSAHIVLQSNFKQSRAHNYLDYLGLLDESFDEFSSGILDAPDMQAAFKHVLKYKGFGKFTSQEILIDLCYVGILPDEYRNQFVVAGPGAAEGIDLIYPQAHRNGQKGYFEAMVKLRDNQTRAFDRLGIKPTPFLALHDIQFNLCETSKYIKILHGTGKKRKYRHKE